MMRKIVPKQDNYSTDGPAIGMIKKAKEPVKIYPRISLQHESFPEVKKCEVGKMCKFMIEAKVVGLSISRFNNDTDFEIHGFEMMDKNKGKGMDDMEEEDKED
jgi:hypothetical protein